MNVLARLWAFVSRDPDGHGSPMKGAITLGFFGWLAWYFLNLGLSTLGAVWVKGSTIGGGRLDFSLYASGPKDMLDLFSGGLGMAELLLAAAGLKIVKDWHLKAKGKIPTTPASEAPV